MGQNTIPVNDDDFDSKVLKSAHPVLVDFWAEWCGPCRALAPTLDAVAGELAGKVTIAKMNVEESPMMPSKYGIRNIPTLILFKNGQPVATKVGGMSQLDLKNWLETNA